MRQMRIVAVLGVLTALAGCGGSSHKTSPTAIGATPSAKAAYVARADALCQGLRASLKGLDARAKQVNSLGDTRRAFALAVPLFRHVQGLEHGTLNRLRALPFPPGDNSAATAYFARGAAAVALVGRIVDALARGDRAALAAARNQGLQAATVAKGFAQGYGFKVCGNGASGNGLT